MQTPERSEHHYRYDPAKSGAYPATTLSWPGDPAAEPYARGVLARLESATDRPPRPRRAVSARLDLALALLAAGQPDEAGRVTLTAVTSGLLVPSNYWRAAEVITAVETHRVPEAGTGVRITFTPSHHSKSKPSMQIPSVEELMVIKHAVKRLFNGAAITVTGIVLVAGPAYATIDHVGGGTWDHGLAGGYVYSNYHHGAYCHGSTAIGVYAKRSPATRKGHWSEAKAPEASFNNETYWRHEAESHCL